VSELDNYPEQILTASSLEEIGETSESRAVQKGGTCLFHLTWSRLESQQIP